MLQVLFWTPLLLEAILGGNFSLGMVKHVASSDPHVEVRRSAIS